MKPDVEPGTTVALEKFKIVIAPAGPYFVYGQPPLMQQFMMPDSAGEIWYYKAGEAYSTEKEPTALCRCGASLKKPYCDGAHAHAEWDPTLTASTEPLLEDAEEFRGQTLNLTDNRKYCAFARFCDARGQVWNLVGEVGEEAEELTIREANHCPAGRLTAWDRHSGRPHEPYFAPSLGLIEDPMIGCSGPLWVRGAIPVRKDDGFTYEVRNRVALCRCGQSSNKPYCDGTHASMKFCDGLPDAPSAAGEEF